MESSVFKTKPVKKLTNSNTKTKMGYIHLHWQRNHIYITKIFQHANIKIAYRTNNTIQLPKTISTINFQLL